MSTQAVHAFVRGRVQGVWFRASLKKEADQLGLCGWVKNCDDGAVETFAEGPRENLEALVAWCHKGPPLARVDQVETEWTEPAGNTEFEIR